MASHDETLDPGDPRPKRQPDPKPPSPKPAAPKPAPQRPVRPAQPGGAAGETVPPTPRAQRQAARDDAAAERVAHPKQFGQYRIVSILGQGGMGVVYTAEQAHPKRRVALKVIRPMLGTRDMIKRFRLEADVLGRLEHPGIARIYDAGTADAGAGPQPYFAMELVKGSPLLDFVRAPGKPPALRDKLELIARLCDAVHYAHEHGVIHRDLKPGNILVEESGQPKILDFGVARVTDSDVQSATMQTDTGSLVGTVQYMSPEQAAGIAREIDARSDVYAMGLIAYEILAGRYPFELEGKPLYEALRIVREQDVPALSSHDKVLRGDVETIVHKAVEKEKSRRYASAAEMASDVRKHLAHRPISARPPSFSYVSSRFLRRNRVLVGAGAAAVLVIALGAAWMTTGKQASAMRQAGELVRRFDQELAKSDWTKESVENLDGVVAQLASLSPADAENARRRMNVAFAEQVNRAIFSPGADADRIASQLDLLAARDPETARRLREELKVRGSTPESIFLATSNQPPPAGQPGSNLFRGKPVAFAAPQSATRSGNAVPLGVSCGENTRAEMALPASWEQQPGVVGFAFVAAKSDSAVVDDRTADGYAMYVEPEYLTPDGQVPPLTSRTIAAARAAQGNVVLVIRRRNKTLRTTKWNVREVPPGPMSLVAERRAGKLILLLNKLSLEALDAFPPPLAEASVAVKLPDGQQIERLEVRRKPLPALPHPLEAADARFNAAAHDEALSMYETVITSDPDAERRSEARFKQGVTLARLKRTDEAIAALDKLLKEDNERWSPAAGCQLWTLYLESDRRPQAYAVIDIISAKYNTRQLAEALPDDMRRTLMGIYVNEFSGLNLLRRPDPVRVERLKQAAELRGLLDDVVARYYLMRAYESAEDFTTATGVAEDMLKGGVNLYGWYPLRTLEAYATLVRIQGEPQRALDRIHEALIDADGDARPHFWAAMVDRARLLDSMNAIEQAERDLVTFVQRRLDKQAYAPMASASLMLGFLRSERGDATAAREAWRAGTFRAHEAQLRALTKTERDLTDDLGTNEILAALAVGCLAEDASDAELERLTDQLIGSGVNSESFELFRRGMFRIPPKVVRAIFADERGRQWARRFAFRTDPPPQQLRQFLALFLRSFLADGTLAATPTAEQDATLTRAAEGMQRMYEHNRIQTGHMLQFALAWKGTSNRLGWESLYEALDADLRGPLGMAMADRFARLGQADVADAVRRQATSDMASSAPLAMPTTKPSTPRTNVAAKLPEMRPPGGVRIAAAAATKPAAPATRSSVAAAKPAKADPAPAVAATKLDEELKQLNGRAWVLRRDGKLAEAAEMRRGVVEKARAAYPSTDERVISFTMDYTELLIELRRFDEAETLLSAAHADAGVAGPAAERVARVTAQLKRNRPAAPTATAPAPAVVVAPEATTKPAAIAKPVVAATAPAPALDPELKFVTDAINAKQYRDAELRLLEMYVSATEGSADDARRRAILLALARVHDAWGKPDQAKLYRDRANQQSAPSDAQKVEWLDAMNRFAFALRQQNRLPLAKTVRQRVVTESKAALPPTDKRLIAFQIDYVDLLIQMKDFEAAEKELLAAEPHAGDPQTNPQAATVRRSILRLYDAWGKPERAKAYQNRAATGPSTRAAE